MIRTSSHIFIPQDSIRVWLCFIALFIFLIVLVGGITRLTDSGLSITRWDLLSGILPPLTLSDWQTAFALYRQTTEYQLVNSTMTLSDFRFIYWWEWLHRFLGRIIGILYFFPYLWFWYRGLLSSRLKFHLTIIFLLGGLQGFLGWWMVQSGLIGRVDVSHIRLSIHLFLASFIFVYLSFVISSLTPRSISFPTSSSHHRYSLFLIILLFIQIILGSLLAGLDGGMAYNTWPKMGENWIASTIFQLHPFWHNLYDNPAMIQFLHRSFPFIILLFFFYHYFSLRSFSLFHFRRFRIILFLFLFQVLLGISTLLSFVYLPLALIHQLFGFILLCFLSFHIERLRP